MIGSDVMTGLAIGGVQAGVNNMFAQKNAEISYRRQNALMNKQNEMNMANMKSAPLQQVEGLRMAGFNPAMVAGAGSMSAPTVSQGNADMPQTIPFNAQDALAMAQIDKLEAESDLIRAQKRTEDERPENVKNDTSLKIAQKLYTNANTDKVEEEAQQIKNINNTFANENDMLAQTGMVMAQKWQKEKWYSNLLPDTRATIDGIADGSIPLSVGAMNAINKAIDVQKNLSDADAAIVKNAFSNAVIESQMSDKEVMAALQKEPWYRKENLRLTNDKISEDIKHIKNEIEKQLAEKPYWKTNAKNESALLGYETEMKRMLNKSFESGDLDYLKSQGEYGKWLEKYSENLLERIIPAVTTGAAIGAGNSVLNNRGLTPKVKMEKTTKYPDKESKPLYDVYGNRIPGTGGTKGYTRTERVDTQGKGVENFNF